MNSIQPWPAQKWARGPERISPPTRSDRHTMRVLIVTGLFFTGAFSWWLLQPQHRGDWWLDYLLLGAFGLMLLNLLLEWRYYWKMKVPPFREPSRLVSIPSIF